MRVMIIYDLPTVTSGDRKRHHAFRKFLKNNGFIMLQESFYSKLVLNPTAAATVVSKIKKNVPPAGIIQCLTVTEKQYAGMETLLGDPSDNTDVVNSMNSLVVF